MARTVGTVVRGVRAPIIREGDDLASIVADSVIECAASEGFELCDRDVIGVTEAVVARAQGNYATVDHIAKDIADKYPGGELGLIFPILSRNRFSVCLRGICKGVKKIVIQLSYPADEVGNALVSLDQLDEHGINPWTDILTEERFEELFGRPEHPFTGLDYIALYRNIAESCGAECEIILANDCRSILKYTPHVLCGDIHSRHRSKRLLNAAGAKTVFGLEDVLTAPVGDSGYNPEYGILGSNKSTEERVKLFPRDAQPFVLDVQKKILDRTGKHVEVLVYGDGAFRDPVGHIWELADPVVSPAYTDGLIGTPNELKLKYLADNDFAGLSGEALRNAITEYIRQKDGNLKTSMAAMGTTPRRLTDLLGSLCDLTSGSGDKGTPIVLVQGYFDNYSTNK
ncbi:MAG: coenzyme F420-0:L-glutamate ligase [Christensenellales bacterium]|jgi:hypothetical protein